MSFLIQANDYVAMAAKLYKAKSGPNDEVPLETYMSEGKLVDPTPMPKEIPHVEEVGVTSAPLKSAAFFIGTYCKDYNDDFMLCKAENNDPAHCLKEGRKVTRCSTTILKKLRENCEKEWETHWQCLEMQNQEFFRCRKEERKFNACVFEKLKLEKNIPGAPERRTPVHLKENPVYTVKNP